MMAGFEKQLTDLLNNSNPIMITAAIWSGLIAAVPYSARLYS